MANQNSINANSTTPLPIDQGGTGVNAVTTSPTASAFAGWDSNKNFSANNLIEDVTSIPTAAGTTVLTVSSTGIQLFTGSTTQTVTLPVVSTLTLGQTYIILNTSSGNVTVQSSGGNTIQVMVQNSRLEVTCIALTGTGTASWATDYNISNASVMSITGTANQILANGNSGTPETGAVTLTTPQDIAATSSPEFVDLTLSGGEIFDANGNISLKLSAAASAVNYLQVVNSAASQAVGIAAVGNDTNIIFSLSGKGNGGAQIQGNTAGTNASTGYVGEIISSAVADSTVNLTSAASPNITSITLTPGDWDIYGWVVFVAASGTIPTQYIVCGSLTSGTLPSTVNPTIGEPTTRVTNTFAATSRNVFAMPPARQNVTTNTTYYLIGSSTFTVSTMTAGGVLWARRAR